MPAARRARFPFVSRALPWVGVLALLALWPASRPNPAPPLSDPRSLSPDSFDHAEPRRGRAADAPTKIPSRGWKDVLWRTAQEVGQDRLTSVAGSVTFYTLLAIFPALGAFVSLYGLFADVETVRGQLQDLAAFAPPEVLAIVGEQMSRLAGHGSPGLSLAFLISLALSLWSASAGVKALFEGLNVAYDEPEKRNYLRRTAISLAGTLGMIGFALVVTAVLIGAPILVRRLGLDGWPAAAIPLRWAFLTLLAIGVFGLVYRIGPSRAPAQWRWIAPGAVAAALFWLGGSLGFSWYINNIAHYDATYGSLGAVVGFMMWLWFSVMVLLVGAELNAELEHQTAIDSTTGAPRPMGERGASMADTVGLALTAGAGEALRALRRRLPFDRHGPGRLREAARTDDE